jgi:hypothetical protein
MARTLTYFFVSDIREREREEKKKKNKHKHKKSLVYLHVTLMRTTPWLSDPHCCRTKAIRSPLLPHQNHSSPCSVSACTRVGVSRRGAAPPRTERWRVATPPRPEEEVFTTWCWPRTAWRSRAPGRSTLGTMRRAAPPCRSRRACAPRDGATAARIPGRAARRRRRD